MSQNEPTAVRRPLLRRAFLFALIPAVILAGQIAKSEVVRVPTGDGDQWTITITPADRIVAALDEPNAPLPEGETIVPESPTAEPTESLPAADLESLPMPPAPVPQSVPVPESTPATIQPQYSETDDMGIAIVPNYRQPTRASEYRHLYDSIPFSRAEYLANPSYRHDSTMELMTGVPRQSALSRGYTPRLAGETPRSPLFLYNRYGGIGPYYGSGGVSSHHVGYGFDFRYSPQYAPAFRYFLPLEDLY
ncbi:MAG: hypothetical protein KDA93_13910 [Planctomycetaceae bacterium]|nr:hypothetical protein [Planctomycetaceae bacterium]